MAQDFVSIESIFMDNLIMLILFFVVAFFVEKVEHMEQM